eukprot:1192342-Prorocentrum_minimum.AAC.2
MTASVDHSPATAKLARSAFSPMGLMSRQLISCASFTVRTCTLHRRTDTLDAREPQNPTKSEEYHGASSGCVVQYARGTKVKNASYQQGLEGV